MVQVVDELITLLTFDADTTKVEKWKRSMEAATKVSGTLLKGLAGVTASVAGYVKLVAMSMGENYAYAKSVGVNVRQYEQLSRMVKVFGGDVSDVQAYIERWSGAIAANSGDVMAVFLDQRRQLLKLEQGFYRDRAAKNLGWSEAMLKSTLSLATADRVLKSAGKIQESEYRLMYETNLQFNELWQQLIWTLQDGVIQAGPKLKNIVSDVTTWVRKMSPNASKSISNFIQGFTDGLKESWPAIRNTIALFGDLSGKLVDFFNDTERVKTWANATKIAFGVVAVSGIIVFIEKVAKATKTLSKLVGLTKLFTTFGAAAGTSAVAVPTAIAGSTVAAVQMDKMYREQVAEWKKLKIPAMPAAPIRTGDMNFDAIALMQYRQNLEKWQENYDRAKRYNNMLNTMTRAGVKSDTTINITLNGTGSNYSDAKFIGSTVKNALSSLGVAVREQ